MVGRPSNGAPEARHLSGAEDRALRGLYALAWTVFSAFLPFFVLWLRDRGFSPSEIGVVLAVTSLAAVTAAPFWSHTADRRAGTTRTLQLALMAAAVMALALAVTGSGFLAVAAVSAVLAMAQSPQTPLTDALVVAMIGPSRLHEYGSFRLWASVGWGVGAIAFGALFQAAGLRLLLPVYAVGLVACALYVGRFSRARPAPPKTASRFGSAGDALTHVPRLPPYLFGVFVLGASTHAAWDFVPLRIAVGGGGPLLVGIAAGVSAFVEIPFMSSSRSLLDRFGIRVVFVAGASVYFAASLAWAIVSAPVAVTLVKIAIGAGFGLTYVTLVVMTGTLVPEHLRNTGQTLTQVCSQGLAPVVGGLVGGFVYQHVGARQLFVGSAVGIAIGIAIVWLATSGVAETEPTPTEDGDVPISVDG
jgi:MFS transporter, PPP family, 3-phenylpropionic acid transporter